MRSGCRCALDLRVPGTLQRVDALLAKQRPGQTPLRLDLLRDGAAGTLDLNGTPIGARRCRPARRPARPAGRARGEARAGQALGELSAVCTARSGSNTPRYGPPGSARLSHSPAHGPRMNPNYLDFEQPIADLEAKIQELRHASHGPAVDVDAEVHALQDKLRLRTAQIFRDLTPWQVSQLARHPARPYTLDYIRVICDEFQELAGDRAFANDAAIVGGLARIDGRSVVVIGHEKGRDTKSKVRATSACRAPRATARRCA